MRHLYFNQFCFNPQTLELRADGQAVTLRPKTAELLRVLINARERVVPKRELIANIWHTEHVTDQSVFQAVSELRAVLAPLNAIRTFPNRGYQWVLPVTVPAKVNSPRKPMRLAAAAAVVSLMGLAGVYFTAGVSERPTQANRSVSIQSVSSAALPALVAFGEGASALQRGDVEHAIELLGLSVVERPEFMEARLLLAEAHLVNGEALEARHLADNVMSMLTPEYNAYSLIAAMDLISRADQQLGQMTSAIEWATRAADQANTNGYECTAADLHDRVLTLVHSSGADRLQASPVFASPFAQRMLQTALSRGVRQTGPHESGAPATSGQVSAQASAQASGQAVLAHSPLLVDSAAKGDDGANALLFGGADHSRPAHCERLRGAPSGELLPFERGYSPLENKVAHRQTGPKPLI